MRKNSTCKASSGKIAKSRVKNTRYKDSLKRVSADEAIYAMLATESSLDAKPTKHRSSAVLNDDTKKILQTKVAKSAQRIELNNSLASALESFKSIKM